MIRKYNYTGRLKIAKERIKITQVVTSNGKAFELNLSINDLGFPDEAKIYVEPYFKSSFMRFYFGSIARITPPSQTLLAEIPITDKILYRVKIVDESNANGLILGYADELFANTGNEIGNKIPLLPVDFNDLGNRIWKLDFRDEGPVLSVNWDGKIEKIRDFVSKDKKFLSLVYPEVIRQIAVYLGSDTSLDLMDPGIGWEALWLKFFDEKLGIGYFPDRSSVNEITQWGDEVSDAFCRKKDIINNLIS